MEAFKSGRKFRRQGTPPEVVPNAPPLNCKPSKNSRGQEGEKKKKNNKKTHAQPEQVIKKSEPSVSSHRQPCIDTVIETQNISLL